MKKLVIFDLDGTLVDSIYDLADGVNYALSKNNLPQNELKDYYYFVGNGMEHLIRSALRDRGNDDELYKIVRKDFDEYYEKHSNDKTVAYDGIEELLLNLSKMGIDTAVLSNKAQIYLRAILEKAFPNHKFSLEFGQRDGVERKPHPEALLMLIRELGYEKSQCVLVGDSDVDILTAKNAQVDSIGVLWGFRTEDELKDAGATCLARNTEELMNLILIM